MKLHLLPAHIGHIAARVTFGAPTSSSERALLQEHLDGLHKDEESVEGAPLEPDHPVEVLLVRAAGAADSYEAIKFARAALIAAQALDLLENNNG